MLRKNTDYHKNILIRHIHFVNVNQITAILFNANQFLGLGSYLRHPDLLHSPSRLVQTKLRSIKFIVPIAKQLLKIVNTWMLTFSGRDSSLPCAYTLGLSSFSAHLPSRPPCPLTIERSSPNVRSKFDCSHL